MNEELKGKVVDLSGNFVREITLPPVFMEEYRPDLIKNAVLAMQSNRLQPKGTDLLSGRKTSAENWGPGRAVARVPRVKNGRRAAKVPQAVGGRRAHPPKTEKILKRRINKKERRKAIKSAIAAAINPELVRARGHMFNTDVELPIVVEDSFASLEKSSEVTEFLKSVGVWADLLRAKGRKIRAGRGKMRGRRYKTKKSILIVISGDEGTVESEHPLSDKRILKGAENLPGVDISYVSNLNAELFAPGTHPGRLTIWTESSITKLAAME